MTGIVNFRLCTLSDEELLQKVDSLTDEMYVNQKVPTRHIPARVNDDYDLLVGELIKRYQEKIITPKIPAIEVREPSEDFKAQLAAAIP